MTQNTVCTTSHPSSNRNKEGTTTMTVSSQHELAALYIFLAEERAEKERLETTNQALVKDLQALTLDYDELIRHVKRKEKELDQVVRALNISSMEFSTLKKRWSKR
jgi:predicted nuclease with TOPRIM domain